MMNKSHLFKDIKTVVFIYLLLLSTPKYTIFRGQKQ